MNTHFRAAPARLTLADHVRNIYNRFFSGGTEYQLFIDIWEGQGAIDWGLIEAQAAAIRINSIAGGTHKDDRFDAYWNECPILKIPYFVYNPWMTGKQNFDWIAAHLPLGVESVMLDIEVIRNDYHPSIYALEVAEFHSLCKAAGWNTAIYTAQWFTPYLSYWPDALYWWAQWPYQFYPDNVEQWSWDRVTDEMAARGNPYPSNMSALPGDLGMWQFTGDRLIVPGSTLRVDINLVYGSLQALADWIGGEVVEPPSETVDHPFEGVTRTRGDGVQVLTIGPDAIGEVDIV